MKIHYRMNQFVLSTDEYFPDLVFIVEINIGDGRHDETNDNTTQIISPRYWQENKLIAKVKSALSNYVSKLILLNKQESDFRRIQPQIITEIFLNSDSRNDVRICRR